MRSLSPAPFRPLFIFFALLFVLPLAVQICVAQSPPPNRKAPPPPPPPAATDQEQFVSYWTTETGWRTELQLRNNQGGSKLDRHSPAPRCRWNRNASFPCCSSAAGSQNR